MLNAQKGRFRKMKTKHECLTGKLLQVSFRAEGTRVGLYKDFFFRGDPYTFRPLLRVCQLIS